MKKNSCLLIIIFLPILFYSITQTISEEDIIIANQSTKEMKFKTNKIDASILQPGQSISIGPLYQLTYLKIWSVGWGILSPSWEIYENQLQIAFLPSAFDLRNNTIFIRDDNTKKGWKITGEPIERLKKIEAEKAKFDSWLMNEFKKSLLQKHD